MGAYFSKENWQGTAVVMLFTLVGIGTGKRIAAEASNMILGYISLFAACFIIVYLGSIGAFYLGTRSRCPVWPSATTILKRAIIPAIVASVVLLACEIGSDFLRNPLFAFIFSVAAWWSPFFYNMWTASAAIASTPCG